MLFNTNKEIGNTALGFAISYFTSLGFIVSLPLNDTQDYDLIFDNGTLNKVQVKGVKYSENGVYRFNVKSCGGTSGKTYKTLKDTNVDYVFVLSKNLDKWLIPIDNIKTGGSQS